MSTYLTPYNIAIANKQKGYDVANIKNDAYQASQTPLRGGQVKGDALRQGDFQLDGGDFWSDFADGFMSVMKPIGQVAQAVAPFIPKGAGYSGGMACRCPPSGKCMCGSGLSGGDEITDAEAPILNPDLNSTGIYHGYGQSGGSWALARMLAPELSIPYDLATGKNPLTGENWGSGLSGGDFLSDMGNVFSQVAPFLPLLGLGKHSSSADKTKAVGRSLMGCGFFDDLLDGFKKVGDVASAVAPHIKTGMDLYGQFKGKGLSGGAKHKALGKKLLAELKALHGAGLSGGGLSGGDFDWSSLLPLAPLLLGLGMSGGQAEPDLSYLEPLISGFGMSGGSFVDDLLQGINSAVGKVGDFMESGLNKVNEGFDKVMPVVEKIGKVAETAGKVASLFSGKKGEGMSGGALSLEQNMNMADAMGDIFSGMGMSGGSLGKRTGRAKDTRVLSGKQQLYKGGAIANRGIPPFNQPTNAGMSGGDTSVNAPYIGWNEASNSPFARPVGGSSEALMAQRQRNNANQPYMVGDGASGGRRLKLSEGRKPAYKVKQGDFCCIKSDKGTLPCNGKPLTKAFMNDFKKKSKDYSTYRQGAGQAGNSESLDEIEMVDALNKAQAVNNPAVNSSPATGGKRPASKWIEHAKAYAKAHGVSYKQALKDAKATYRGAGQSGGDFWSDLGNVASTVAPFLPLLL